MLRGSLAGAGHGSCHGLPLWSERGRAELEMTAGDDLVVMSQGVVMPQNDVSRFRPVIQQPRLISIPAIHTQSATETRRWH